MKYTIKQIFTKEREGRNGKFTSLSIKTEQTGDEWISGFLNDDTASWRIGSVVDILVNSKIVDVNGETKEYKNFEVLPQEKTVDDLYNLIKILNTKIDGIIKNGVRLYGHTSPTEDHPHGIDMINHPFTTEEEKKALEPDNNLDDIPF